MLKSKVTDVFDKNNNFLCILRLQVLPTVHNYPEIL